MRCAAAQPAHRLVAAMLPLLLRAATPMFSPASFPSPVPSPKMSVRSARGQRRPGAKRAATRASCAVVYKRDVVMPSYFALRRPCAMSEPLQPRAMFAVRCAPMLRAALVYAFLSGTARRQADELNALLTRCWQAAVCFNARTLRMSINQNARRQMPARAQAAASRCLCRPSYLIPT